MGRLPVATRMRLLCIAALAGAALAQPIPVTGLAGARFHVADLGKAREFYTKVFGFPERSGNGPGLATFLINNEQYVEFSLGASGEPLETIVFIAAKKLAVALQDPDGRKVEFVQGRVGGPTFDDAVSNHLLHIGAGTTDLARMKDFYGGRLGGTEIFRRPDNQLVILKIPGPREDWVEFILRNEQGSQDHICLGVPDIQKAYQTLLQRGAAIRGKPRVASNGHWVINMADTNGVRVELMEPQPAPK